MGSNPTLSASTPFTAFSDALPHALWLPVYDQRYVEAWSLVLRPSGQHYDWPMLESLPMMELKGLVRQVGGMNYIRLQETQAKYDTV